MFGLGQESSKTEAEVAAEAARIKGYGGHSMVAPLRRVIVQAPTPPLNPDDGKKFGYPRAVDHQRAVAEHDAFCKILEDNGVEVIMQPENNQGLLDAIFVFDDCLIVDEGAILANPGKAARLPEVPLIASFLPELDVPVLGQIEAPGKLEVGDLMWIDRNLVAAGLGYRTNQSGIDQLRIYLQYSSVDIVPVSLPHWRGPDECLHLLSLISPVAERLAIVHLSLLPVPFVELLESLGWTLIPIPEEEFVSQATNVLALAPGKVLMLKDNPITRRSLEDAGCEVLVYTGDEISHNRAGGPTCLTRPLLRDVSRLRIEEDVDDGSNVSSEHSDQSGG